MDKEKLKKALSEVEKAEQEDMKTFLQSILREYNSMLLSYAGMLWGQQKTLMEAQYLGYSKFLPERDKIECREMRRDILLDICSLKECAAKIVKIMKKIREERKFYESV